VGGEIRMGTLSYIQVSQQDIKRRNSQRRMRRIKEGK
jgi:hypothetical protein